MKKFILLITFCISLFAGFSNFLMPNKAFIPHVKLDDKMYIKIDINIADGIYLYADKVKINLEDTRFFKIKEIQKPETTLHDGDNVYLTSPTFLVSLQKIGIIDGIKEISLKLSYQGCSIKGLCYEPYIKTYKLNIDTSKLSVKRVEPVLKTATHDKKLSQTDVIAESIKNSNIFMILITFFGFGLLLSFTPCVFPMIPIISGIIISHGKGLTTLKAFILSIIYVLAMAVAYTIAGILAGLFGSNLQAMLQNPWVIYSFSGIFVVLALSMFGLYELKLPDSLVKKVSSKQSRGGYIGVAIMGFLSALIVGPCVAAPLAGALVYIGQTGDAFLGGIALFSMSIGMGIPLVLVGVSAGKFMPRPGIWMNMVSSIFGVMMLGIAIWMLERVVDEYITMFLYAVMGIGFSVYLGVFEKGGYILKKTISIIIFIYSMALLIGVLGGSKSMAKPLEFLKPQIVSSVIKKQTKSLKFLKISSLEEFDMVLKKNRGKKIILDFYASWCTSCKELEEITFSDKRVVKKMNEFVLIQADITANTKKQKELTTKYKVFGPPVILFFNEDGKLQKSKSIVGFVNEDEFLARME